MFYPFAHDLPHASTRPPVVWEVETVLAAVLKEAVESESRMAKEEIEAQARVVLEQRNLAPGIYAESRAELEHIFGAWKEQLDALIQRVGDRAHKAWFTAALRPDKTRILEATRSSRELAAYFRESQKNPSS